MPPTISVVIPMYLAPFHKLTKKIEAPKRKYRVDHSRNDVIPDQKTENCEYKIDGCKDCHY